MERVNEQAQELLHINDMIVEVSDYIPEIEHDGLWGIVEMGFHDLNSRSYEKQDMTKQELVSDLQSASVLKYVARDTDLAPIGLMTVHKGLDTITWANTNVLSCIQKEIDPSALPYYVGTLVVPLSERGTNAARNLLYGALLHFSQTNKRKQEDALVFFDCADANYPWLAQFIQAAGKSSGSYPSVITEIKELYMDAWVEGNGEAEKLHDISHDIDGAVMDRQHYYVMRLMSSSG